MIRSTIDKILITMVNHNYLTLGAAKHIANRAVNYDLIEKLEFIEHCGFSINLLVNRVDEINRHSEVEIQKISVFKEPRETIKINKTSFKSIW